MGLEPTAILLVPASVVLAGLTQVLPNPWLLASGFWSTSPNLPGYRNHPVSVLPLLPGPKSSGTPWILVKQAFLLVSSGKSRLARQSSGQVIRFPRFRLGKVHHRTGSAGVTWDGSRRGCHISSGIGCIVLELPGQAVTKFDPADGRHRSGQYSEQHPERTSTGIRAVRWLAQLWGH